MKILDFSIITVCLNSEKTILDTVRSIQRQTFKNYEHIIIDGGSTDSTCSIIKSIDDARIILKVQKGKGIYGAMNEGINYSKGNVIGFLNSDDLYSNTNVLSKINSHFKNSKIDIVHGNISFCKQNNINTNVRFWKGSDFKSGSFKNGWHPPHPSFYMKNKSYSVVGLYREDLPVSADFDLMLRSFEINNLKSVYIDTCFVNMRLGGESTGSLSNIIKGNIAIARSFKDNNIKINLMYFVKRFMYKLIQKLKK
jgi:glycosyltransferase involved in cell wall biosynthesis